MDGRSQSRIASFFAGKTILLTGSTGFLGAVLVEKLLRSCPELKRIYLLIRKKDGMKVEKRLAKILSLPLFSCLDAELKSRVTAVEGDVAQEDGGLAKYDKEKVLAEVEVVFHVAAYINFNAGLGRAVSINVQGTSYILDLAKRMPNIRVFIYTSTAYCNCTRTDVVQEKVYPSPWKPRELIQLVETLSHEKLSEQQPSILGELPNAYVFTKLLAENLISTERGTLPVAIVRPTIVMGTLKSPWAGWVDNVNNGATAFIAGAGRGVFRTIHGDGSKIADLVPCDHFVNLLVAAAWDVGVNKGLKVYHHTSGADNPITWGAYCKLIIEGAKEYPCSGLVFLPKAKVRSSKLRHDLYSLFAHYVPAFVLDFFASRVGEKPVLVDIQNRYFKGMQYTSFFTFRQWVFDNANTYELYHKMDVSEREEFDFDSRKIDWPSYMKSCVHGVRRYFHMESDRNLPLARLIYNLWRVIDAGYHILMFIFIFAFLYNTSSDIMFSCLMASSMLALYVWF